MDNPIGSWWLNVILFSLLSMAQPLTFLFKTVDQLHSWSMLLCSCVLCSLLSFSLSFLFPFESDHKKIRFSFSRNDQTSTVLAVLTWTGFYNDQWRQRHDPGNIMRFYPDCCSNRSYPWLLPRFRQFPQIMRKKSPTVVILAYNVIATVT